MWQSIAKSGFEKRKTLRHAFQARGLRVVTIPHRNELFRCVHRSYSRPRRTGRNPYDREKSENGVFGMWLPREQKPHIQTAMPTLFCASYSMVTCSVHRSYSQLRRTGATRTTERNRKSVCLIVNVSCKTRATQSSSHGLIPAALYGRRRRRPW